MMCRLLNEPKKPTKRIWLFLSRAIFRIRHCSSSIRIKKSVSYLKKHNIPVRKLESAFISATQGRIFFRLKTGGTIEIDLTDIADAKSLGLVFALVSFSSYQQEF